jgi:two-component system, cell cycle response regulator DivK
MIQTIVNKEFEQLLKPGILQSVNVLVAEDDETNFFLIKEYLEFSKANLLWAKNGKQATEMVGDNSDIDIVFMDIQMPEMNGYEALKRIKEKLPNLPIVALTAYAVSGDREKGLKAGFNEYLSKPISRKILMELIVKFIQRHKPSLA